MLMHQKMMLPSSKHTSKATKMIKSIMTWRSGSLRHCPINFSYLQKLRCSSFDKSENSQDPSDKNNQRGEEKKVIINRVISRSDVEEFGRLTGDNNPVHRGDEGIVQGAFLLALAAGVMGTTLPGPGCVVVAQEIKYPAPCRIGDNISICVKVVEDRKIMSCSFSATSSDGVKVLDGIAKLVFKKS